MASDLSSECTETIGVLDEKEEGEISLEDVSSSEEGHLNYGYGTKISHCSNCLSTQHNTTWCTIPAKFYPSNGSNKRGKLSNTAFFLHIYICNLIVVVHIKCQLLLMSAIDLI